MYKKVEQRLGKQKLFIPLQLKNATRRPAITTYIQIFQSSEIKNRLESLKLERKNKNIIYR